MEIDFKEYYDKEFNAYIENPDSSPEILKIIQQQEYDNVAK